MEKMVAYCGIVCSECPAYIAHKENNDELRKKTAEEWSKAFQSEVKPEDVNCVGCLATDGVQIPYCATCELRRCGLDKKVENCAYCDEYICEKLGKWFERTPEAKERLEEIRKK